jgi:hypothetical protein
VVRLDATGYGGHRQAAVSPDMGRIREGTTWKVQAPEWKTTPPVRLTEDQKTALYSHPQFTVTVGDLRPGDVVAATDIDNHTRTRKPVTITEATRDTTVNLRYRNETVSGKVRKRAERQVTVLDRPHGALTGHELLVRARPEAGLPPWMGLLKLARQEPTGQHVLLELSPSPDAPDGLEPGRLAGVEQEQ